MKNNTEDNTISANFIYVIPLNNTAIKSKLKFQSVRIVFEWKITYND